MLAGGERVGDDVEVDVVGAVDLVFVDYRKLPHFEAGGDDGDTDAVAHCVIVDDTSLEVDGRTGEVGHIIHDL